MTTATGCVFFNIALYFSDLCYRDLEGQTVEDELEGQKDLVTIPALTHLGETHSETCFLIIIPQWEP